MAKKQATIQDIAKALNITASTVSRALNDHPKIKKATKDMVWARAAELNYQLIYPLYQTLHRNQPKLYR